MLKRLAILAILLTTGRCYAAINAATVKMMIFRVFRLIMEQSKIAYSIVGFYAVDMMNKFFFVKDTTYMVFHNKIASFYVTFLYRSWMVWFIQINVALHHYLAAFPMMTSFAALIIRNLLSSFRGWRYTLIPGFHNALSSFIPGRHSLFEFCFRRAANTIALALKSFAKMLTMFGRRATKRLALLRLAHIRTMFRRKYAALIDFTSFGETTQFIPFVFHKLCSLTLVTIISITLLSGKSFSAISAATTYEVRTTGNQQNGGGFADLDPGTSVDYSQQAAPILALTDCNHPAGSGTLTSATGGFTAAMKGSTIYVVSGTNFTTGWYQITAYTSSNQVTVDRSLGASACVTANGVVNVGGAFLIGGTLDDDFGSSFVAGNTCYIKAGTYTVGETISWSNGTSTLPIVIEGYNASRGDDPCGTDRPLLDCSGGSYSFGAGNYNKVKNLRVSSPATTTFNAGSQSVFVNCWGSHGATGSVFLCYSSGLYLLDCEIYNPQGTGINHQSNNVTVKNCYIHDCATGISAGGSYFYITDSIFDSCKVGINVGSQNYHFVSGNTIRGCLTGISGTTSYADTFVNNIIADNYVGAAWTTEEKINYWDYNCWYNNDTDNTNVTQGANKVTGDPAFVSVVGEGADGATDGAGTAFTAASNPFGSVTTADCLVIVEAGTGATTGVYNLAAVVGDGELTLARTAGANKSGIDYKIIKGSDHTLGAGSSCFDTGLAPDTYIEALQ